MSNLAVCLGVLALLQCVPESRSCRKHYHEVDEEESSWVCSDWRHGECQAWRRETRRNRYTYSCRRRHRTRRSTHHGEDLSPCGALEYASGFHRASRHELASIGLLACRSPASQSNTSANEGFRNPVLVFLKATDTSREVNHSCPEGFFLKGFFPSPQDLGVTKSGRCSKPEGGPPSYGDCYMLGTNINSTDECKESYFVTAFSTRRCGDGHVCPGSVRCCQMVDASGTFSA